MKIRLKESEDESNFAYYTKENGRFERYMMIIDTSVKGNMKFQRALAGFFLSVFLFVITINAHFFVDAGTLKGMEKNILYFIGISLFIEVFAGIFAGLQLLSLSFFFIILAYIYNCGQVLLNYLDYDIYYTYADVKNLYGEANYINHIVIALISIAVVYMGMMFVHLLQCLGKRKKHVKVYDKKIVLSKKFACVLLAVSLPFSLYTVFLQLYYGLKFGYGVVNSHRAGQFQTYMASLLLPGIIILIATATDKKKKWIYLIYTFYCFITMLGGIRSAALLNFLVCTYVYLFLILKIKINWKKIILFGVVALVLLEVMIGIRYARPYGITIESFTQAVHEHGSEVILDTIREMSGTEIVLAKTMGYKREILTENGRQMGVAFLSVILGISKLVEVNLSQFSMQYVMPISHLGGSFVSDFYFDNQLLLFSFLFGILLQVIFSKFEVGKDIFYSAYWAPILPQLIFSVRSSTTNLPRLIVWYSILFLIVYVAYFLCHRERYNES